MACQFCRGLALSTHILTQLISIKGGNKNAMEIGHRAPTAIAVPLLANIPTIYPRVRDFILFTINQNQPTIFSSAQR